jgi:hypothetical protein
MHLDNCIKNCETKRSKYKREKKRWVTIEDIRTASLRDDQERKSAGGMPRHQTPKKDVVSCEKPWGVANRHRSMDIRMGEPGGGNAPSPLTEQIGERREPGELKHLSSRRKRKRHRFSE